MPTPWFLTGDAPSDCAAFQYNPWLVIVAYLAASLAAYGALHLHARRQAAHSPRTWGTAAGLTLGAGIWTAEIAMLLGLRLPLAIRFAPEQAIAAAAVALLLACAACCLRLRARQAIRQAVTGTLVGIDIAATLYLALAALRLPAQVLLDPTRLGAGAVVAIGLSTLAFAASTSMHRTDRPWPPWGRIGAAAMVGLAVVAAQFAALSGACFQPAPDLAWSGLLLSPAAMGLVLAVAILVPASLGLAATLFDLRADALLRDAVDSVTAGFVIYDAEDRLVVCNEGHRRLFRQSAPALRRGATFEAIIRYGLAHDQYPPMPGAEAQWLASRLRHHHDGAGDVEQQLADGTWVLISERRMRNGGIAGLCIDITALKTAQAALADSEARLDRAQELAGIGSWAFDVRTGERIWSKEMYRIRGVLGDDVDPTLRGLERFTHTEDRIRFRAWLDALLAGGQPGPIEYRIRRPDGQLRVVRAQARGIADAAGQITRVEGTLRDVTDQRRTEDQLRQAQKMEAVGQLTGGMAHDFNNILTAVIGNLDLAAARLPEDDKALTHCRLALNAALSGAELVKRLLAFSRRQALRPEPTRVEAVIDGVMPLLRRTLGEHIRIKLSSPARLWPALADTAQLESAILNLVINARDAMPEGGSLSLELANAAIGSELSTASGRLAAGDYVLISVRDSGSGMTPDQLSHAFEPFFTTKPPGQGSGLGLSMVFGTMQQLGGAVHISSELGHGTVVQLYLPRAAETGVAEAAAVVTPEPTGHERVLMVEDNPEIRTVGRDMLASLGYTVITASDGDEALRTIEAGLQFDLLFTDVVMPGSLNGMALAQAVRQRDPKTRILFTSGFADADTLRQRIDIPGSELLAKPYRRGDLAQAVRAVLNRIPEGTA
jgi:PAS domain S-box-containing protein